MKRALLTLTVLTLCLLAGACSFIVDFVIVNESEGSVRVEYSMDTSYYGAGPDAVTLTDTLMPRAVDIKKWEAGVKDEEQWSKLPYEFNADTRIVTVVLPPKNAMRVLRGSDRLILDDDGYKEFPIKKLTMIGANGNLALEGLQIFKQFTTKDKWKPRIIYK